VAIYTGKVVDGKVVVDGALLEEGTKVTILIPEDQVPFHLTPDMEAEIEESIAQLERGEGISAEIVLAELRRPRGGPTSD
jgi:hypothetical protein